MRATDEGIRHVNSLLRGELAATETYQQALAKLQASQDVELHRIHAEHREAANTLRKHVHECGGKPEQGSGAWGTWAKLVEGTAKVLGETATLKALKEGEEQGMKEYQEAADADDLSAECRGLIRNQLLPQTREHIATLDRLMTTV